MSLNAELPRILEHLELAREELPEQADTLDLQIAFLQAQIDTNAPPIHIKIDAEEATRRRRQGRPLVSFQELDVDWENVGTLFRQICQISAIHRVDLADTFLALEKMRSEEPQLLVSWVADFLNDSPGTQAESEYQNFILTHTLRPFLRRHADAYSTLLDETGWRRGYCPICGGKPDMSYLGASAEGPRYLVCSRCDNEWLFERIGCPFCGNRDHSKLQYFPEDKGPHRLYTCELCKRYLKAIDLRQAPGRVLMPAERVLTISMDIAARTKGYT